MKEKEDKKKQKQREKEERSQQRKERAEAKKRGTRGKKLKLGEDQDFTIVIPQTKETTLDTGKGGSKPSWHVKGCYCEVGIPRNSLHYPASKMWLWCLAPPLPRK